MNLAFRTLNGKKYIFEANPSNSLSNIDFSRKIPNISPETRFIYKGDYLDPSTTISSLNLTPNDFIVISNPSQIKHYPRQPMNIDPINNKTSDGPSVTPLPDISRSFFNDSQSERVFRFPPHFLNPLYRILYTYEPVEHVTYTGDTELDNYDEEDEEDLNDTTNPTHNIPEQQAVENPQNSNNEQENQLPPQQQNAEFNGIEGSENLTSHDKEVIKRLQEMTNIDKNIIAQVFIACNKEENLTADCLFSGNF